MVIKKPASLKMQSYEFIREAVINQTMKRDVVYSEKWFADNFQISRTPVREALLQLRSEGLIEVLPNRGVIVKPMTLQDARNIFQTRIVVESFCANYLAQRFTEKEAVKTLDRIEALLHKTHADFNRPDELQFHIETIQFVGNPEFLNLFNHMRARIDVFWNEIAARDTRQEEVFQEHKKILDAMRAGDTEGASQASTDHLKITYNEIIKKLSQSEIGGKMPYSIL